MNIQHKEWYLCDVVYTTEHESRRILGTADMLDMYGEFIKLHHTEEEFAEFAKKWVEEHKDALGSIAPEDE